MNNTVMAKKKKKKNFRGFTIIEVMIVLAIAGLIMLILFLAVPAVLRNARNHSRKNYANYVLQSVHNYYNDYRKYPGLADLNNFRDYVDDGSGNYTIAGVMKAEPSNHTIIPEVDDFYVASEHWCNRFGDGNSSSDPIAGVGRWPGRVVVWTSLETRTSTEVYCIDNHP